MSAPANGTLSDLGRCRSCGAYVVFLRQLSGRTPPFNVAVDPLGNAYVIERDPAGRPISHFATCPNADEWRGRVRDEPQNADSKPVNVTGASTGWAVESEPAEGSV